MTREEFEKHAWETVINPSSIYNIDLRIDSFGFENATGNKKPVTSEGSSYRLHFIVDGKITLHIDDNVFYLKKNTVFLLDPTRNIIYEPTDNSPVKTYWVSVIGKEAKNYLQTTGIFENNFHIKIASSQLNKISQSFFTNFVISEKQFKITEIIFMENFFRIIKFICINNQLTNYKSTKAVLKNRYIEEALSFIKQHYTESDFSLATLANHLHLHKNYLSATFKKEIGVPFNTYIAHMRYQLALSLIGQGYTSVVKIADTVGIPDPSYFTKVFKKLNTISPKNEILKRNKKQ